ncbi:MAG: hypothetical protein ACPGWR_06000 [Ardenticatenaceae bacterium]
MTSQEITTFLENLPTTLPIGNALAGGPSPTLRFISQQQVSPDGMRMGELVWLPETNEIQFQLVVEPSFLFAFLLNSGQMAAPALRPFDKLSASQAQEPPLSLSSLPQNHVKPRKPPNIEKDVEKALKDYHRVPRLAGNPLTQILDLRAYQRDSDHATQANGLALRRALDQTIDAVTGPNKPKMGASHRHKWQPEHYLHLRYREGQSHKDLAAWMDYTERHLQRKRKELIRDAATLLWQQARNPDCQ